MLALRVSDEQLKALHKALGPTAGMSWRPRTAPCASTSPRWSMCGREGRVARRFRGLAPAQAPDAAHSRCMVPPAMTSASTRGPHTWTQLAPSARWRAFRGPVSTAPCGWRSGHRSGARPRAAGPAGRGDRLVACVYALNTTVKLIVRRRDPNCRDCRRDQRAHAAQLPQRPCLHVVRRRTAVHAAGAARSAAPGAGGQLRRVALYLGVHYPSDMLAGALLGRSRRPFLATLPAVSKGRGRLRLDEHADRHRRDAQRGQVLAVQRAHQGRSGGRQLPVHHDRAQRRRSAGARSTGWRRWPRLVGASEIVWDTIDFHDIAGLVAGAHEGEGLGNRFLANIRETDAIVHVVRAHSDRERGPPRGPGRPMARHRNDRDRAGARRPRAGRAARGARRKAGQGRR